MSSWLSSVQRKIRGLPKGGASWNEAALELSEHGAPVCSTMGEQGGSLDSSRASKSGTFNSQEVSNSCVGAVTLEASPSHRAAVHVNGGSHGGGVDSYALVGSSTDCQGRPPAQNNKGGVQSADGLASGATTPPRLVVDGGSGASPLSSPRPVVHM
mmetsp:Transcript_18089/g.41896  ORF Transcript_18089/g.41896 Transcript_18089/m.41896 type:complete len:156 (-) Transcript_18089:391-858(-)